MKKRSFLERLSGSVPLSDDYDAFDDDLPPTYPSRAAAQSHGVPASAAQSTAHAPIPVHPAAQDEPDVDGQLPVDVYQTDNEIVVRAFIAGVRADDINLSISRDMIVIDGAREEREQIVGGDFFTQELFWGTFSRTILLPQEVDVDNAAASAKDGLLSIILPKLDKSKQTKLRVKSG